MVGLMDLLSAIQTVLVKLPELLGEEWAEFESALDALIASVAGAEADPDLAQAQLLALFGAHRAAHQALLDELASATSNESLAMRRLESKGQEEAAWVPVPVCYVTDREPTLEHGRIVGFSGDRGEVSYGIAEVTVPSDRDLGDLPKPRWWKLEFSPDPAKHLVLKGVESMDRSDFLDRVRGLADGADRTMLVFVHGYNVSFEDAARRTAQIAHDLGLPLVPMLYSWPSEGAVLRYGTDAANVEWTIPHFTEFLSMCLRESGAESVHVVAHSMGNRALVGALENFELEPGDGPTAELREVVLAAPDVDADVFRRLAAAIARRASRVTLYASAKDKPLLVSRLLHKYARAGDTGRSLVIKEGIDTIDATAVSTSFVGHSYVATNKSVVGDIHDLIRTGDPPDERKFRLAARDHPDGRYWFFRRELA